jgi:hypothetical protein
MDWRYNTVWFDQLDRSKVASFRHPNDVVPKDLGPIEYLSLWNYRTSQRSLSPLPISDRVLFFAFYLGGLKDLTGISRFSRLKRLEIHRCRLDSAAGLDEVTESLEHLHISHAPKIDFSRHLAALSKLRILRLANCGQLESLEFLLALPSLLEFRFVGTTIRNGDLGPLLRHPSLRVIASQERRGYHPKVSDIQTELDRTKGPIPEERVFKDQIEPFPMRCETFRYIY